MSNEPSETIARVAQLHGRATEVSNRMQQDARLLVALQQELSVALRTVWELCREPKPLATPPPLGPSVLRIAEVSRRIGLARSSIWKMVNEGTFPQPYRLTARAIGWKNVDVDEWLNTRAISDGPEGPKARDGASRG